MRGGADYGIVDEMGDGRSHMAHSALRHRSLLSDTSELTSNAMGLTGTKFMGTSDRQPILSAYNNHVSSAEQLAENERLLANARDHRRKNVMGHETATVLQELADSQISKLRDSNRMLNQSNIQANNEI